MKVKVHLIGRGTTEFELGPGKPHLTWNNIPVKVVEGGRHVYLEYGDFRYTIYPDSSVQVHETRINFVRYQALLAGGKKHINHTGAPIRCLREDGKLTHIPQASQQPLTDVSQLPDPQELGRQDRVYILSPARAAEALRTGRSDVIYPELHTDQRYGPIWSSDGEQPVLVRFFRNSLKKAITL